MVFQATQGPMGMTLVKVLLVWCMYSDVTELEPRALQAAAPPPPLRAGGHQAQQCQWLPTHNLL